MPPKIRLLQLRLQRPVSLRFNLIFLVLVTTIPLLVFSIGMIFLFAREERATFQRGATERTRALLTTVDLELWRSIATLEALATSIHFDEDNLRAFYDEAARVIKSQPGWFTIILAAPTGQQVVNLGRPFGADLPMVAEKESLDQVLRTGKPTVGPLSQGLGKRYAFAVRVPVIRNGVIKYVLTAVVDPQSITELLLAQKLPPDWIGVVLDGNKRFVARTVDPKRNVGEVASESLRAALDRAPEGWFHGNTIEGWTVYTPYNRSPFSGWTVALGIPAAAVEATLRASLLYVSFFGIAFLALGLGIAWYLSSRTAGSIHALAGMAKKLGLGDEPPAPAPAANYAPSPITEVRDLRESFLTAVRLIGQRSEERDRVEAALRQVTERLELSQEAANIGSFERDLVTNEIKWSASQEKLYGLAPGSFRGKHEEWAKRVHPDDIATVEAWVRHAAETLAPINLEFRIIRPDGAVRWVASQARVFADESGAARRMLGVNIDITQRKRSEQLQNLHAAMNFILAESPALREAAPKIVQVFCEIAGWEVGAIWDVDRRANRITCVEVWHLPSIDVPEFAAATRKARFAPGTGLVGRVWRSGRPMWISDVTQDRNFMRATAASKEGLHAGFCFPIKLGADVLGVVECFSRQVREPDEDFLQILVTIGSQLGQFMERKRAEEGLREADRRKDQFLAMLGHELRNPLGVISTAVQLLRKKAPSDSNLTELREMIERQVEHMAQLMDDLLDVSRIARGRIQLNKKLCDFTAIVRDMAEDYRTAIETSGLQMTVVVPSRPLWIMGDRTRVAQAVGNLLHNANKFTDAGGKIGVRLTETANGETAVLSVSDTGVGMEPEILAHAFEPFSQADRTIDRSRGGLGLGLALVKGLVELHGGKVQACSEGSGRGSEITIRLPLEPEPTEQPHPAETVQERVEFRRILIIEDNPVAARSLRMFLTEIGHTVEVAYAGPEGIEAARRSLPEVVLCDIGLPGLDGYEVARALRREPRLHGACLIAVTGYGQDEDQRRALEAGFDIHMTKPVNLDDLERILVNLRFEPSEFGKGFRSHFGSPVS
ncbi:MAG TPA: ATP-binding protein [Candidatus Binatia bacterium]|nr:ATP-binding protein [Candidatus Binatia bacterium]